MARDKSVHIGIFGRRNYGKSTLINCILKQDISIVSEKAGTTTDPVKKTMEIFGVGPVTIIDTAGFDDYGDLGQARVKKTNNIIKLIDLAILLVSDNNFDKWEQSIIHRFEEANAPYIIVYSKSDISIPNTSTISIIENTKRSAFLLFNKDNRTQEIEDAIIKSIPETAFNHPSLLGDIIETNDIVLLITPIDSEAPEGRMILPQVQAIRDILDNNAVCIVLKETEVDTFLRNTNIKPKLVITDSQAFKKADSAISKDIPLTSFSIMLAHHKGNFKEYLAGTPTIDSLKDGDRILLLESCTHQVSCEDIGRYKIPKWLSSYNNKQLSFDVVTGFDNLPYPINNYALVIQCGGCMISRKQLNMRLKPAISNNIPVTNYGMAIAYTLGIYSRAIAPFVDTKKNKVD